MYVASPPSLVRGRDLSDEAEAPGPDHQGRAPVRPSLPLLNEVEERGCTEQQVVGKEDDRKAEEEKENAESFR